MRSDAMRSIFERRVGEQPRRVAGQGFGGLAIKPVSGQDRLVQPRAGLSDVNPGVSVEEARLLQLQDSIAAARARA